jgi:hypothetical protein
MSPQELRERLNRSLPSDWERGEMVTVASEDLDAAIAYIPDWPDGTGWRSVEAPDHGDIELTVIMLIDRALGILSDSTAADRVLDYVQRRRQDIAMSLATVLPEDR